MTRYFGGGGGGGGGGPPSGPAGGQLGGNYPNPFVLGMVESAGPTPLLFGAVANGQVLQRVGGTVQGLTPITAPVNPTDNGKIPRVLNGDFSYVGGLVNQVLAWNDGSSQWEGQTNPQLGSLALLPLSGVAAATGSIRGGAGFNLVLHDSTAVDREVMLWDAVSRQINLGSLGASITRIQAVSTINFAINNQSRLILSNSAFLAFGTVVQIGFDNAVVNPNFSQQPTASATGTTLGVRAQNSTTGTGGALELSSGTGTTAAGEVSLMAGSTKRIRANNIGLAFFNVAPIAQRTLVDSTTGVAANTLVDVGAVPTQAAINNNFASLRALINAYGLCA